MKQDWTVRIYKADYRFKDGRRIFSTTVWRDRDEATMEREVREIKNDYSEIKGFYVEFDPTMKAVINLMTGEEVMIAWDTPRSCDPSTELYWIM